MDDLLTLEELATRLKVPKSWLYLWARERGPDTIPKIYVGKYLRFEWNKVEKWIMRQEGNHV